MSTLSFTCTHKHPTPSCPLPPLLVDPPAWSTNDVEGTSFFRLGLFYGHGFVNQDGTTVYSLEGYPW